jgi:hypothetical protein
MEDMRAVLMHIYSLNLLAIDIASCMGALVNHEASLPLLLGKMGECGAEESGAYYQIVVGFGHGFNFKESMSIDEDWMVKLLDMSQHEL